MGRASSGDQDRHAGARDYHENCDIAGEEDGESAGVDDEPSSDSDSCAYDDESCDKEDNREDNCGDVHDNAGASSEVDDGENDDAESGHKKSSEAC